MWPFSYSSSGNSPFTERTQIPHSHLTGLFAMATGAEAHGYCSIKSYWPCKKANWPMTAPKQNLNCQMINLYLSTEGHAHECQPTRKTLMIKTKENPYNEMDRAKQRKKKSSAISEPSHPKINQSRLFDGALLRKCRWVKSLLNPSRSGWDSTVRHSSNGQIKPRMGAVTRANAAPVAFVVWRWKFRWSVATNKLGVEGKRRRRRQWWRRWTVQVAASRRLLWCYVCNWKKGAFLPWDRVCEPAILERLSPVPWLGSDSYPYLVLFYIFIVFTVPWFLFWFF